MNQRIQQGKPQIILNILLISYTNFYCRPTYLPTYTHTCRGVTSLITFGRGWRKGTWVLETLMYEAVRLESGGREV